jgi:hypothetical protein
VDAKHRKKKHPGMALKEKDKFTEFTQNSYEIVHLIPAFIYIGRQK